MVRILVVDDDWTNLETMQKACQFLGYEAILCDAGVKVCQLAAECQPDLIVLDMHLQDLDGLAVYAGLREAQATASIPVVFLSAGPETEVRGMAMAAGVKDYLSKPVSLVTLQSVIHKYTT